jgi:hypothetical protein
MSKKGNISVFTATVTNNQPDSSAYVGCGVGMVIYPLLRMPREFLYRFTYSHPSSHRLSGRLLCR